MKGFHIGQVCELLDVGPHVIRYWERELPLLSPKKDEAGRRVYTRQELNLLLRIHYLVYTRKFTLAGAQEELWKELSRNDKSLTAGIGRIRSELLYLEGKLREQQKKLEQALSEEG